MAEPGANDMADALLGPSADLKHDTQALADLQEYLRRYRPSSPEAKRDVLTDRFRIELSTPLPEYDGKNVRAYAATDLQEPSRLLFAQVCPIASIQRQRAIQLLKPVTHQYIMSPVAAGTMALSRPEEERFVIFYERPAGRKLSEFLAQQKFPMNTHILCDRIIAPIASALHQFSELGIAHGSINPDNIYFSDIAVVGPCVAEPCGYTQPFLYEPLERMQAEAAGKGEGTTAQDFYALSVIVLQALHGPQFFQGYTPEILIRSILREGVYNAVTRQYDLPEIFYDFFRGMLCQNAADRWDWRYVRPWLEGKRYNVLSPPSPAEAVRPFEFNETQAHNRRELAHILATNWDKMTEPVVSGKLTQWASVSLRNKELADALARISKSVAELGSKNEVQVNEQLMRVLLLLDPQGPIRMKQLSFHIDGIDTLSAELHASQSLQELQTLAKFIEFNMTNYWLEIQRKVAEYEMPPAINTIILKLERLRACIRNSGMGFGIERMLYDLNPDMPCLSPILTSSHVTTLPGLLRHLDQLAPSQANQNDPIDRHLSAFMASKLNIQHEIRLHALAAVPSLANHRAILALYLLSTAQQRSDNMQLPGLTHWLALRIMPALDIIHSRSLRNKIKALLVEQASAGYMQLLAELVVNADYATIDQAGFTRAMQTYHNNAVKIHAFRKGNLIDHKSTRVGFTIAKGFAYAALLLSILSTLKGG